MRIVFLGDSITDGHTYPLLIQQALAEKGLEVPTAINAGIGGDTAAGMRARLERDVFAYHPTLVTFNSGANDVAHHVTLESYETDVTAIAAELQKRGIPMLILTTSITGPNHTTFVKPLEEYNGALRRIAAKFNYKIAEVTEAQQKAHDAGETVLETDGTHPNFEGQRLIARAVLDALGHPDVPVPAKLNLQLMPGVIREWKMRPAPDKKPLDDAIAKTLTSDDTWKTYNLPDTTPLPGWPDQERQRGFAMEIGNVLGPDHPYQGVTIVEEKAARKVYFNTGAQLQGIWLNGVRIYKNDGWHGWHAGRERIPAELQAGKNTVVIETNGQFFLSITDNNTW